MRLSKKNISNTLTQAELRLINDLNDVKSDKRLTTNKILIELSNIIKDEILIQYTLNVKMKNINKPNPDFYNVYC